MGLFAAIRQFIRPSTTSYATSSGFDRFESFMEEFSNILQRQATRRRSPGGGSGSGRGNRT